MAAPQWNVNEFLSLTLTVCSYIHSLDPEFSYCVIYISCVTQAAFNDVERAQSKTFSFASFPGVLKVSSINVLSNALVDKFRLIERIRSEKEQYRQIPFEETTVNRRFDKEEKNYESPR